MVCTRAPTHTPPTNHYHYYNRHYYNNNYYYYYNYNYNNDNYYCYCYCYCYYYYYPAVTQSSLELRYSICCFIQPCIFLKMNQFLVSFSLIFFVSEANGGYFFII